MKKVWYFILRGYQHETNSYLPFSINIKGPINFLHGTYGIFISGQSIIGKNCTIYHQVTIGSNMLIDSSRLGSPIIGNNVIIGAGAKVIGSVKVGNNVRIGANAVVFSDIPDDSVVVLNKPQIKSKINMVNKIYQRENGLWGYLINGNFVLEEDLQNLKILNNC